MAIGKMQRLFPYLRRGSFVYVTTDAVSLPESCRSGYSLLLLEPDLHARLPVWIPERLISIALTCVIFVARQLKARDHDDTFFVLFVDLKKSIIIGIDAQICLVAGTGEVYSTTNYTMM